MSVTLKVSRRVRPGNRAGNYDRFLYEVSPMIKRLQANGIRSAVMLADALNKEGIPSNAKRGIWTTSTARRAMLRGAALRLCKAPSTRSEAASKRRYFGRKVVLTRSRKRELKMSMVRGMVADFEERGGSHL